MRKLFCSTQECSGDTLQHVIDGAQPDDEPVVLLLSVADVAAAAHAQFEENGYPPKPDKLRRMREALMPGGTLYVPWIEAKGPDDRPYIYFSDGRHRSLVLHEKNYQTIPVGTMRRLAESLRPYWASRSIADTEYDFQNCEHPVISLP